MRDSHIERCDAPPTAAVVEAVDRPCDTVGMPSDRALARYGAAGVARRVVVERCFYYAGLRNFGANRRGWAGRMAALLAEVV